MIMNHLITAYNEFIQSSELSSLMMIRGITFFFVEKKTPLFIQDNAFHHYFQRYTLQQFIITEDFLQKNHFIMRFVFPKKKKKKILCYVSIRYFIYVMPMRKVNFLNNRLNKLIFHHE